MTNFATVHYIRERTKHRWDFYKNQCPTDPSVVISLLIYEFDGHAVLKMKRLCAETTENIGQLSEVDTLRINDLLHSVLQELMPATRFIVLGLIPNRKKK